MLPLRLGSGEPLQPLRLHFCRPGIEEAEHRRAIGTDLLKC